MPRVVQVQSGRAQVETRLSARKPRPCPVPGAARTKRAPLQSAARGVFRCVIAVLASFAKPVVSFYFSFPASL